MHLVDAHRAVVRVALHPPLHPLVVAPLVVRLVHDGRLLGRDLAVLGHRVGLEPHVGVAPADGVLVVHPLAGTGDEQLPHAGRGQHAHGVREPVPAVEVADDVDRGGGRRPHRERDPFDGAERPGVALHMRAEHLPELLMAALVEEEPVHLTERWCEPVRVVLLVLDAVVVGDEQAVVLARGDLGGGPGPDPAADVRKVEDPSVLQLRADGPGQRPVCRDGKASVAQVVAEQVVRLRVASLQEGRDGALVGDHGSGCESGHLAPRRVEKAVDGMDRDTDPAWAVASLVADLVQGLVELEDPLQPFGCRRPHHV